jgi:NAD+ kinase
MHEKNKSSKNSFPETGKDMAIAFVSSDSEEAKKAKETLIDQYGQTTPEEADVIVALGGDGLILQTLHAYMNSGIPIYGMNRGSVGFLMNDFDENELIERLMAAKRTNIHPLATTVTTLNGEKFFTRAINEVSLWRRTYQAGKLRIYVDGKVRMSELICDGALLATPAGSTAYNLSAHGPILPINASLFALTPISPFRPRRWRGALLSNKASVQFEVLEPNKRPMNVAADHTEFKNIKHVDIRESAEDTCIMLFDAEHGLDERILSEQFDY